MENPVIVFVGSLEQRGDLHNWDHPFEHENWKVHWCTSISEAKKIPEIDVLFVWAYGDDHIEDYNDWDNKPPAIWYCIGDSLDEYPKDAVRVPSATLPSDTFKIASELVKK